LDFAYNKATGVLESATKASKWSRYKCPVCNADVIFRSGSVRKDCFAHWPGYGSLACENFVPSHHGQHFQEHVTTPAEMKRMELCLLIPLKGERAGWSLELALPSCRECRATVTLDVGGRSQTLDISFVCSWCGKRVPWAASLWGCCIYSSRKRPTQWISSSSRAEIFGDFRTALEHAG